MNTSITIAEQTYEVVHTNNLQVAIERAKIDKPRWISYDTETTGLHLKKDVPFYAAVCWKGIVFIFPPTPRNLNLLVELSTYTKRLYAHNVLFDMCMTANIIGDKAVLSIKNWADTMCLGRMIFESISPNDGGDSLALKKVGVKYISKEADQWKKEVDAWLKAKEKDDRKYLRANLNAVGWTFKALKEAQDNKMELPDEVKDAIARWKSDFPEPTYQDVPLEIMLPYLAVDVILMDILIPRCLPVIVTKEMTQTFAMECQLIPVVFKMVRTGFLVDREYLIECRTRVKAYMAELYEESFVLFNNQAIKAGQHKAIKEHYNKMLDEEVTSTDKAFMRKQSKSGDKLAAIISKLRTCEKWVSTYIDKVLRDSEYDGRIYPSLNPYNPVTGRFSGDFQQMPKRALLTLVGDAKLKVDLLPEDELYHPRKSIKVSGGIYNKTAYIDVSQYELRWGAHYTLQFGGDLNLCRAYMPFKCINFETKELFDPYNPDHISRWDEKMTFSIEDGETHIQSAWMMPENGLPWVKTDVHSSTTTRALPLMGLDYAAMTKELFEEWRNIGKLYNFMKFYGGGVNKVAEALDIKLDEAKAFNNGFEEAFPLLVVYSQAVSDTASRDGYMQNLYGRRYYLSKSYYYYKLANYMIQGGTADDFKRKMIVIDKWLEDNDCLSRMVHPIHDEIIVDIADGEDWILPHIKAILEYTPLLNVPVVAEVSTTESTWERKKKVA